MNTPDDLRYSTDHEWARVEGDRVRVGITDFAQDNLGDVVFVSLPAVGSKVTSGDSFGEVESTKSVSDLYAPVSGEILEINHHLSTNPGLMNQSPYDEGWVIKIRVADPAEMDALLDHEGYAAHIGA